MRIVSEEPDVTQTSHTFVDTQDKTARVNKCVRSLSDVWFLKNNSRKNKPFDYYQTDGRLVVGRKSVVVVGSYGLD